MSYLSIGLRVFWLLFPTLIYYLFAFIIFDRYLSNGYFYMFAFTCCWFFSCSRLRTFSTFNRYVSIALLPLAVFCEGFFSLSLSFCTQEQYTFCLSCTWRFFSLLFSFYHIDGISFSVGLISISMFILAPYVSLC